MSMEEIVKSLIDGFKTTADVRTVYGEPITFYGKTLIPIAKVGFGLGAGEGKSPEGVGGSGAGGGGGTEPVGFLLVSEDEVKFIPITKDKAEKMGPPAGAMALIPLAVGGLVAALVIARRLRQRGTVPPK